MGAVRMVGLVLLRLQEDQLDVLSRGEGGRTGWYNSGMEKNHTSRQVCSPTVRLRGHGLNASVAKTDLRTGYSPHQSLVLGDVMVNCADTTPKKVMVARARRRNMVQFFMEGMCNVKKRTP